MTARARCAARGMSESFASAQWQEIAQEAAANEGSP